MTNRLKALLGTTNWWDAPPTTLTAALAHANNVTNPHVVTAAQVGAAAILTQVKTVDGAGSGLDTDLVGGLARSVLCRFTTGAYNGDGTTSGRTVSLGYTPFFVMIQRTADSGLWCSFATGNGLQLDTGADPFFAGTGVHLASGGFVIGAQSTAASWANANAVNYLWYALGPVG